MEKQEIRKTFWLMKLRRKVYLKNNCGNSINIKMNLKSVAEMFIWFMTRFSFPFCEHDVMLRVGLRKYEIFRTVEQERNRVGVKGLFEMTSWYLDVSFMWLRIDTIQ